MTRTFRGKTKEAVDKKFEQFLHGPPVSIKSVPKVRQMKNGSFELRVDVELEELGDGKLTKRRAG